MHSRGRRVLDVRMRLRTTENTLRSVARKRILLAGSTPVSTPSLIMASPEGV